MARWRRERQAKDFGLSEAGVSGAAGQSPAADTIEVQGHGAGSPVESQGSFSFPGGRQSYLRVQTNEPLTTCGKAAGHYCKAAAPSLFPHVQPLALQ